MVATATLTAAPNVDHAGRLPASAGQSAQGTLVAQGSVIRGGALPTGPANIVADSANLSQHQVLTAGNAGLIVDLGSGVVDGVIRTYFQRTGVGGADRRIYQGPTSTTYPYQVDKTSAYVFTVEATAPIGESRSVFVKGPVVDNQAFSEKQFGSMNVNGSVGAQNGASVLQNVDLGGGWRRVSWLIPASFWTGSGDTLNLPWFGFWTTVTTSDHSVRKPQLTKGATMPSSWSPTTHDQMVVSGLTADAEVTVLPEQAQLIAESSFVASGAVVHNATGSLLATASFVASGSMFRGGRAQLIADGSFLGVADVIYTGKSLPALALPKLAHSIVTPEGFDTPVAIEGFEAREKNGVGMAAASALIQADVAHRFPHVYREGANWRVTDTATGEVIFSGELLEPAPDGDGRYRLAALGDGIVAEDETGWLIYREDGTEDWGVADAEPFSYQKSDTLKPVTDRIAVLLGGSRIVWTVEKGTKFEGGEGIATLRWAEDEPFRRVAFTPGWDGPNESKAHYRYELVAGNGPDGDLTLIQSWSVDALAADTELAVDLGDEYDMVGLLFRRKDGHARKTSSAFKAWAKELKTYSVARNDDFTTSDVARDLAARMGVSAEGVEDTDTDALPRVLDDGSFQDALVDLAVEDDFFVGIWNDGRGRVLHYAPWGRDTYWVEDPSAEIETLPTPRYDRVRVPYMVKGQKQFLTVKADEEVFPVGKHRTKTIDLSRPGTKSHAQYLGSKSVDYLSRMRWGGSGNLRFVTDAQGRKVPAWRIRAGSELVLVNHGGKRVRVGDVTKTGDGAEVQFDDSWGLLERWLARIERYGFRGRPGPDRNVSGSGAGRPAVPANVTIAFKKGSTKARTEFRAVVDFNRVTTDVGGDPAQIDRYEVQLQPTNGAGTQVEEKRKHVVHEPEDEDADAGGGDYTKTVFHDLERPRVWYYRARVRAIDQKGRKSEWSGWTGQYQPADSFGPAIPTRVLFDVDQHKVRARWDAELDPDDSDLVRPEVDFFQVQMFDHSPLGGDSWGQCFVDVRGHKFFDRKVPGESKTWRIAKPGNTTYYFRVRSVANNGVKSNWVTVSGNRLDPPTPPAPTIAFDQAGARKGDRTRAIVNFTGVSYLDDDVDRYIVQFQSNHQSTSGGFSATDHRERRVVDATDTDPNDPLSAIFKGIRRRFWYRARVRAVDKKGHKSAWSDWSNQYQGTDSSAPPPPTGVTWESDVKGLHIDWDAPLDPDDNTSPHPDVTHYEVEVHGDAGFSGWIKRDLHQTVTKKRFKGLVEANQFWVRVRSVSSSNTKSGWVTYGGLISGPVVDRPSIQANAVGNNEVDAAAVGNSEVQDFSLTNTELSFAAGITVDRLNINSLSAISANLGTVTAGSITSASYQSAPSGARIAIVDPLDGANDRINIYDGTGGWGNLVGSIRGVAGDVVTTGRWRIDGSFQVSDTSITPEANHAALYKVAGSNIVRARFPDGTTKDMTN